MEYLLLKWVHIISSTLLFGTGIGSAFTLFMANRSKELPAICFATRYVVLADWLFTSPAAIIQLITGILLAMQLGTPLLDGWVFAGIILYLFVGACWLPVVKMQITMRDLAQTAMQENTLLPERYWQLSRLWVILGSLAFPTMLIIFYLMVFKPF